MNWKTQRVNGVREKTFQKSVMKSRLHELMGGDYQMFESLVDVKTQNQPQRGNCGDQDCLCDCVEIERTVLVEMFSCHWELTSMFQLRTSIPQRGLKPRRKLRLWQPIGLF